MEVVSAEPRPNLGPTPAIGHHGRCSLAGRLLHPRSLETHNRSPPIWGSRGREFKSRQPDRENPSGNGFAGLWDSFPRPWNGAPFQEHFSRVRSWHFLRTTASSLRGATTQEVTSRSSTLAASRVRRSSTTSGGVLANRPTKDHHGAQRFWVVADRRPVAASDLSCSRDGSLDWQIGGSSIACRWVPFGLPAYVTSINSDTIFMTSRQGSLAAGLP
jgi:hypothetical protein